jgi:hypothetical protein
MTDRPRPFLVQALAGVLTFYAMAGAWLAMAMVGNRDPRLRWLPLVIGGAAFAICAGIAAIAVWRRESRGPLALSICAVVGAILCIAMPLAVRDAVIGRDTWLTAIAGGLLFGAFLLLAARYVRLYLRAAV